MKFLTLRKDATPPPPDPQAAEVRVYADENGNIRSVDHEGNDNPAGGGADGIDGTPVWQGDWSAGTYEEGQAVAHEGSSYVANTSTSDEPPSADWDVLAAKGEDGMGGSQPGIETTVRRTFTENAAVGTLTATVELPNDSILTNLAATFETAWGSASAVFTAVDEAALSLVDDPAGVDLVGLSPGYTSWGSDWGEDIATNVLYAAIPYKGPGKPYPSGQTLTFVVTTTAPAVATGSMTLIVSYITAPDTAAAVYAA